MPEDTQQPTLRLRRTVTSKHFRQLNLPACHSDRYANFDNADGVTPDTHLNKGDDS